MTIVHIATDADRRDWDQFANKGPLPHHALLWPWRGILSECFGHQPQYLIARRTVASGENEVVGILPLFFVSSILFGRALISVPYLNGGGVLADDKDAYDALLRHANELAESLRVGYMELRHRESSSYAPSDLVERSHKHAMLLPITADPEELWSCVLSTLRGRSFGAKVSRDSFQRPKRKLL